MPSVCFVTLSRSDYASLRPVALAALADPAIDMRPVSYTHLTLPTTPYV